MSRIRAPAAPAPDMAVKKAKKVATKQRNHKLLTPAMALKKAMEAVITEKPLVAANH